MLNLKFKYYDLDVFIKTTKNVMIINDDFDTGKSFIFRIISTFIKQNANYDLISVDRYFESTISDIILDRIKNGNQKTIILLDNADSYIPKYSIDLMSTNCNVFVSLKMCGRVMMNSNIEFCKVINEVRKSDTPIVSITTVEGRSVLFIAPSKNNTER